MIVLHSVATDPTDGSGVLTTEATMIITFAGLKGGVGKTTSAALSATVLAEGGPTILIDADPQGSAQLWAAHAERLPFEVVGSPTSTLARLASELAQTYKYVVIDTPPAQSPALTASLAAATIAVLPLSTGSVDLPRLAATVELVDMTSEINRGLVYTVLLTKTRSGTLSRRHVREALVEAGYPVLAAEIPLTEAIGGSEGDVPEEAAITPYRAAVAELQSIDVAADV